MQFVSFPDPIWCKNKLEIKKVINVQTWSSAGV